ncbi:MAG: hypothetical protein WKF30_10445 [Pyrinomonadaceae bacterium]
MFKLPINLSGQVMRAITCCLIVTLLGQTAMPAPILKNSTSANTQSDELVIPDGTELAVVTTEEISSKTATEGDPVTFKVEEDLLINNQIVIAKGTIAKGTISAAEKSGRLGKGGKLGIRVESTTTVDGQKIKLRASQGKEGGDKTGTTIALVALFGVFGFFKKEKTQSSKKAPKSKFTSTSRKRCASKAELFRK